MHKIINSTSLRLHILFNIIPFTTKNARMLFLMRIISSSQTLLMYFFLNLLLWNELSSYYNPNHNCSFEIFVRFFFNFFHLSKPIIVNYGFHLYQHSERSEFCRSKQMQRKKIFPKTYYRRKIRNLTEKKWNISLICISGHRKKKEI